MIDLLEKIKPYNNEAFVLLISKDSNGLAI